MCKAPIKHKYYQVPRSIKGVEASSQNDLGTIIDLRNEIAHFLPRIVKEEPSPTRHVPPWFEELYQRRLFMRVPEEMEEEAERQGNYVETTLDQLFSSYRLAYWAWESVTCAAMIFVEALGDAPVMIRDSAVNNFKRYESVCPPDALPQYDAHMTSHPHNRCVSLKPPLDLTGQ